MRAALLIFLSTIGLSTAAFAQATLPGISPQYQYEAIMKTLDQERRVVIAGELELTDEERDPFWDLYGEYADAIREISDARAATLGDFARNYDAMTNEVARRLLDDAMRQDEQKLKIRRKYISKFRKIIPDTKAARLYQIENKFDAALEHGMGSQIPLTPDQNR